MGDTTERTTPQSADPPVYSIGAVARMLGVSHSTLRSWEERYGAVVAHRSDGGHRLYSRGQVAQLRFVKSRMDEGLQAGEAHRLLKGRLDAGEEIAVPAGSSAGPRLAVLLAERDPYAAELSEYFLTTEGYVVQTVLDPAVALDTFDVENPDLTVIELMMSGGQGTELVASIAERGGLVLALAALDLEDEALHAGAGAFLRKPYDPLRLVSAVRDLLGTSALVRGEETP